MIGGIVVAVVIICVFVGVYVYCRVVKKRSMFAACCGNKGRASGGHVISKGGNSEVVKNILLLLKSLLDWMTKSALLKNVPKVQTEKSIIICIVIKWYSNININLSISTNLEQINIYNIHNF